MTIRKLSAIVPLAALVGAVVHVAVAGFDHAPGGRLAVEFFGALASALGIALAAAFFAGALGGLPTSIATWRERAYATGGLALAGTAIYAALELADGHFRLGGLLRGLASSFPVAALVLAVSLRAGRCAHVAGSRFAASIRETANPATPLRLSTGRSRPRAYRCLSAETRRGRAPPLFV